MISFLKLVIGGVINGLRFRSGLKKIQMLHYPIATVKLLKSQAVPNKQLKTTSVDNDGKVGT